MHRRAVLRRAVAGGGLALAGCSGPVEVTERPTGEIDVVFRTEADRSVDLRLELVDADGEVVDSMASPFPPDGPGAPSFYAGGLSNAPYTLTIATDADSTTIEYPIADCPRLEVVVTVQVDATLAVGRTCTGAATPSGVGGRSRPDG